MALLEMNWDPSRRELRQFAGIWFPACCVVIGILILSHAGSVTIPALLGTVALVVSFVGLLRPSFIRPIYLTWMCAVYPLGWTISHLLLMAIFFLVITPAGILIWLFRYDPMERNFDRVAQSYWVPHNPGEEPSRYFRQL